MTIKTRLILAMTMLWMGAAFAQMPAKDGVLLDGEFVYKNGMLDLTLWGLNGNFSDPSIRGLAISVGQLCAVNPATGATIADTNNLVPAVVRTMEVKNNGYFVNGNVGINTNPSSVSTEKLKVAGSIQSTLAGSAGGYMFADTTNTHRESRLETAYALVPIGAIVPFFKFTGCFMPGNFVECNGQTVSDPDSPLNHQPVPDLNDQAATVAGSDAGA